MVFEGYKPLCAGFTAIQEGMQKILQGAILVAEAGQNCLVRSSCKRSGTSITCK
ncbi:hypothetical protein GBAR_LOCUS10521 [Geodia barretti]|uniref:Uncharacterized protein n=1 Tax=Geodia barretti TaxID=519541 RepID=A0AA35RVV8_GEOBA|nr:hypothetical protein GBAR_LOCUS10521 [Geodia barretti]